MTIYVLSGEIASGKSTLARALDTKYGFELIKTRELIQKRKFPSGGEVSRIELQHAGEALDRETRGGAWLADEICQTQVLGMLDLVIDAARIPGHVEHLRDRLPGWPIVHVHLWARGATLRERFALRGDVEQYDEVKANPTEASVNELADIADLVIDTSSCSPDDVLLRVLQVLKLRRKQPMRNVDVIVGGQYGSEGKGHIVAHIADDYDALVRVGGPNAGHTVLHPQTGEKVSFYHIPSGALHARSGTPLILGPGAVINPEVLEKEAKHLGGLDKLVGRLFIDPQANIITKRDIEMEAGLVAGIGSTGQGVGVATAGKITERAARTHFVGGEVGEVEIPCRPLARDFPELKPFLAPTIELLDRDEGRILLEGTQGTGLSLHHGHYPYVTSRDTTVSGTAGEAGIPPARIRKSIVVMRTNPIRVQSPSDGTSGPMGKEITWEEIAERAGVPADVLREREKTTTTKRQRRVAEFNWQDLERAVRLNGPTDIALTFLDYLDPKNTLARRFEQLTPATRFFINEIERMSGAPVSLMTTRCHRRSIIDRRTW